MSETETPEVEPVETPDEAETPEEGETITPDEHPEPAPSPEPLTDAEIEKLQATLTKENERHAKRVREIIGADADELAPCPLCIPNIAGYVWGEFIPDDQREAVLELLGGNTTAEYADDPEGDTCPVCNGYGQVTTGSHVLEHLRRPCPACVGLGYLTDTTRAQWEGKQAVKATVTPPTPVVQPLAAVSDEPPIYDQWGRHQTHHLYGRDPRYLTATERQSDLPQLATA